MTVLHRVVLVYLYIVTHFIYIHSNSIMLVLLVFKTTTVFVQRIAEL